MAFNSGIPDLQAVFTAAGVRTPFGLLLPPGARVAAYVRSGGAADGDPPEITQLLVTTLNAGLARCRASKNDLVIVLPGHSENITAADSMSSLVAGTRIIGWGRGSNAPTIRWTHASASFRLDVADVVVSGLRLRMEGANGVTAPITVSAADCEISDCDIEVASSATNKATTAITVATGAARFRFVRNTVRGTATHNCTDVLKVTGVVAQAEVANNRMLASATAGNGLVHVTAAATELYIHDNDMFNSMTNSTSCITVDDVAATGVACRNALATLNSGTATDQGLVLGAAATLRCFENYSCDEAKKSGILTPAACT